jgi:hypothetical protein
VQLDQNRSFGMLNLARLDCDWKRPVECGCMQLYNRSRTGCNWDCSPNWLQLVETDYFECRCCLERVGRFRETLRVGLRVQRLSGESREVHRDSTCQAKSP